MRTILLAAVLAAFSFVAQANAQSMCGPHDALVAKLGHDYGEAVVFQGQHPTRPQMIEVLVNPATGSFTVLVTNPETSCVTAAGVSGALVEYVAPVVGDPS